MTDNQSDLVQAIRLALAGQTDDVRLFTARLVRKYRNKEPKLAAQLDLYLKSQAPRPETPARADAPVAPPVQTPPGDDPPRPSRLKLVAPAPEGESQLFASDVKEALLQLIEERRQAERLAARGLAPTRSALFVGKPGIGKTLAARWLAAKLGIPLYVLDLSLVTSSSPDRNGSGLAAALNFCGRNPCVLLLDDMDAPAMRAGDDTETNDNKRLLATVFEAVRQWPPTGLLLATINHPAQIDPALLRRFEVRVDFKAPDIPTIKLAIKQFLGTDAERLGRWVDTLALAFNGESLGDIEREIQRFRRAALLGTATDAAHVEAIIKSRALTLDRHERISLAVLLAKQTRLSQHTISDITGVSRDTIRKYSAEQGASTKKTAQ